LVWQRDRAQKQRDQGVADESWFARVPTVGEKREEKESRAEQRLALSDPRDTLDVHRVYGKQRRNDPAADAKTGGAIKQKKQQKDVHAVKQQADGVVAMRV